MSLLERKRGTGGKFKKNSQKEKDLSLEDLNFLKKNTALGEKEIREWYSGFIEDNPDGQMRREKLLNMYVNVLSNAKAKTFVNQIFSKYDTDNSGSIDFKEFMMATTMTGDVTDKLRLAFRIYDEDGSGTVDRGEMVEIVSNMYTQQGVAMETAVERANEVFAALDLNEDGTLDEQEFVEGCMKDQSLAQLLNTGSTQLAEEDTGDKK